MSHGRKKVFLIAWAFFLLGSFGVQANLIGENHIASDLTFRNL